LAKPEPDPKDELRRNGVHLRQTTEALAEATGRREAAGVAGDLEIVRKIDKRIADLTSDKRALTERRVLLAQQAAEADLAYRTQARDVAINSTVAPALARVVDGIQQFEAKLTEAAAAYSAIKEAFTSYTRSWPAAVPPAPAYADFTLAGLHALMKQALQHTGRQGDFEFVMHRFGDELPSAALRRQADAFVSDLKAAQLPAAKRTAGSHLEVA
jgi:hypothetical protein